MEAIVDYLEGKISAGKLAERLNVPYYIALMLQDIQAKIPDVSHRDEGEFQGDPEGKEER